MRSLAPDETILHNILEFINRHYAQPLTLAQISQVCGMSPSTFSMKFKQYIGQTFIEYRNDIRVRMAQEALLKTTHKITTISQDVGFDDLSFFNKLFKKITGVSPGEYRKRHYGD
jgi:YesN/AraC family two-component response regulator